MVYVAKSTNLSYSDMGDSGKRWEDLTHIWYIVGIQGKRVTTVTKE